MFFRVVSSYKSLLPVSTWNILIFGTFELRESVKLSYVRNRIIFKWNFELWMFKMKFFTSLILFLLPFTFAAQQNDGPCEYGCWGGEIDPDCERGCIAWCVEQDWDLRTTSHGQKRGKSGLDWPVCKSLKQGGCDPNNHGTDPCYTKCLGAMGCCI